MVSLKEQYMDNVIDMIMGVSLSYLLQGVFLKDAATQQVNYFRLDEEQTQISYEPVDPTNFVKSTSTPMKNPTISK